MDTAIDGVKARLAEQVDRRRDLLLDVSHQIHAHPETNYEERFAHDLLTRVLEDEGLPVVRGARGIETAFEARVTWRDDRGARRSRTIRHDLAAYRDFPYLEVPDDA